MKELLTTEDLAHVLGINVKKINNETEKNLESVSSILEKDCIHKEMYDTIALSMQQIMEVVQTAIAMSELDEFTVLH